MSVEEGMSEKVRMALEDAVAQALEEGASATEVREEVDYAIESYEDDVT